MDLHPTVAKPFVFFTYLSLFTLSPITIPIVTQLTGDNGLKSLQESLDRSFNIITDEIKHDKKSILLASSTNNIVSIGSSQNPPNISPKEVIPPPKTGPKEVIPPSIYEDQMKCVVIIKTNESMGSGFFISKEGIIVTNAHVVGYDSRVSVLTKDQKALLGTVVAVDVNRDLALVSVMGDDHPSLALGNIGKEGMVGNDVIAIGIPEGLSWSISKGIISAIRDVKGILILQTDTAINRGNSGGPLISLNSGRVIGINSFGFRKDIATGLNFAISVSELRKAFPTYVK
jgi:S1-C subfamily serine protease